MEGLCFEGHVVNFKRRVVSQGLLAACKAVMFHQTDSSLEDWSPRPGTEEWPGRDGVSCLSTSARGGGEGGKGAGNSRCHNECPCVGL